MLARYWVFFFVGQLALELLAPASAAESNVTWLISYEANLLPGAAWTPIGKPSTRVNDDLLTISDDSTEDAAGFDAEWNGELEGREIVVEATVKVVRMVGHRNSIVATWPQRDGAPICVVVSDGAHEDGMLLTLPAYKVAGAAN